MHAKFLVSRRWLASSLTDRQDKVYLHVELTKIAVASFEKSKFVLVWNNASMVADASTASLPRLPG